MNTEFCDYLYEYTFIVHPEFGLCLKKNKECTSKEHSMQTIVYYEELVGKLDDPDQKNF